MIGGSTTGQSCTIGILPPPHNVGACCIPGAKQSRSSVAAVASSVRSASQSRSSLPIAGAASSRSSAGVSAGPPVTPLFDEPSLCGNGRIDLYPGETADMPWYMRREQCDEGLRNSLLLAPYATCRPDCTRPVCGDGILDRVLSYRMRTGMVPVQISEECDDGNLNDADGCDRYCRFVETGGLSSASRPALQPSVTGSSSNAQSLPVQSSGGSGGSGGSRESAGSRSSAGSSGSSRSSGSSTTGVQGTACPAGCPLYPTAQACIAAGGAVQGGAPGTPSLGSRLLQFVAGLLRFEFLTPRAQLLPVATCVNDAGCGPGGTCTNGQCTACGSAFTLIDGVCLENETVARACDDGNACTKDTLVALWSCTHEPVSCLAGTTCDPGAGDCYSAQACVTAADCPSFDGYTVTCRATQTFGNPPGFTSCHYRPIENICRTNADCADGLICNAVTLQCEEPVCCSVSGAIPLHQSCGIPEDSCLSFACVPDDPARPTACIGTMTGYCRVQDNCATARAPVPSQAPTPSAQAVPTGDQVCCCFGPGGGSSGGSKGSAGPGVSGASRSSVRPGSIGSRSSIGTPTIGSRSSVTPGSPGSRSSVFPGSFGSRSSGGSFSSGSSRSGSSRSSTQSRSSAGSAACTGTTCARGAGTYCAQINRSCYETQTPPCFQCGSPGGGYGDDPANPYTPANPWTGGSGGSQPSGPVTIPFSDATACSGNECEAGAAYCGSFGLSCGPIADLPCFRCTDEQTAEELRRRFEENPWGRNGDDGMRVACRIDDDCPAGARCIQGRCLTSAQIGLLPPFCGNARLDPGEQCDEGAANADVPNALCRTDCRLAGCGDGILDTPLELCDDGNLVAGDGCSPLCRPEQGAGGALPGAVVDLPFLPGSGGLMVGEGTAPPSTADTGPAAVAVIAAGAAAGWAFVRRRRR